MEENTFEEGRVLFIDKPLQWTSFDVVKKIRGTIRVKKVGHAGTLDPLATGMMIVCTGKFTKKINEFMAQEKRYEGTFTLGAVTPTYDLESQPTDFKNVEGITMEMLRSKANDFTGDIMQVPPIFSAIKQKGAPVYLKARKGENVKLDPRKVFIYSFEITGYQAPVAFFKVTCSSGTYIRSLANDFGKSLGCGAYLSSLRRTRIGEYDVKDALTIDEFVRKFKRQGE